MEPAGDALELVGHLFDDSRDAYIVIKGFIIVYANKAAAQLMGLGNPQRLLGTNALEIMPPEYREKIATSLQSHMRGERPQEIIQVPFTNLERKTRFLRLLGSNISLGADRAVLVMVRDDTNLHEMKTALLNSEERNKAILASITDPINIKDQENRFIWVNAAQAKVMGLTPEAVMGRTCQEIGYCSNDCEDCAHINFFKTGETQTEIALGPDGNYWNIRREPIHNQDGEVVSVLEVSREVTDQIFYENKLETLHEHVRKLNNANSFKEIGYHTLKTIERVLGFNQSGFSVLNNELLEIIVINEDETFDPITLDSREDNIPAHVIRTDEIQYLTDTSKTKGYRPWYSRYRPVKSEIGVPVTLGEEPLAVISIFSPLEEAFTKQDIKLVSLLSDHVSSAMQRILALENMDRIHEQFAKETIEGIQRISSRFMHDLRGPLQSISNAAYLLRQSESANQEILSILDTSLSRSKELIEEMHTQTEAHNLKKVPQDINELMDNALHLVFIPAGIKVVKEYDEEFIAHMIDHSKIRQVFLNLIKNAVDAMPDGGTIKVSTKKTETSTEITVTDTGIGVSEMEMKNMFKPFYSTKMDGLGLGLTYSKRVVEAHKGEIIMRSEPGKGTSITIQLPNRS